MKKEKIIFLDIDGVLNPYINVRRQYVQGKSISSYFIQLDEECLSNLQQLVLETNAKIVISSSWRKGGYDKSPSIVNLINQLNKYKLKIYGYTPILDTQYRGDEIREYIRNSIITIESFVILDDNSNMCEFTKRQLVVCPSETGFGKRQLNYAKIILTKKTTNICNDIKYNSAYSARW